MYTYFELSNIYMSKNDSASYVIYGCLQRLKGYAHASIFLYHEMHT